jgi:colanic acid biosynthesis glycosyl transferase WcaI
MELIYNWCDDALICRDDKDQKLAASLGMKDKFNIVFAGNMGKAQAMDAVLNAAEILAGDYPEIQFVLIGGGVEVEHLKAIAAEKKLLNVLFLSHRSIAEIGPILRCADVLLVHLRDEPLFRITIPSKTQAYMALGRPILMGLKGDAASLVEEAKAGLACEPENPLSIAEAARKFYAMNQAGRQAMGENGMRFYDSKLSFSIAVDRFEKIFEAAVRTNK